jgi:hypothetical protein
VGNDDDAGLHFDTGLDEHEWTTRWSDIDETLADTPREGLGEAVGLIRDMLTDRGFPVDETTGAAPTEDAVGEYRALRDIAQALDADRPVGDDDVADAVDRVRALYRFVADDRREWGALTADEPDDIA